MKTETIIWHEIIKRPMTDEEKNYFEERCGEHINSEDAYLYEPLPSDGEEVLVCVKVFNRVCTDVFCDDYDGACFETYELDDIKAWAEMPKGV